MPVTVADVTACSAGPVRADFFRASKLFFTTVAVSGDPSWKVMPGRRVRVQTVYVELGVTDWARYGLMVPSAAWAVSGS